MVNIQIDINNEQDRTVSVFKAIHNLSSKQDAVIGIIKDWENIQTLDIKEIQDKLIEKIKEEHEDDIRKIKSRMRSCYEDYEKGMIDITKKLCKKYKKTEKQMVKILDGESYEEEEDKFKDKVWNDWEDGISKLQSELPEKYNLESSGMGTEVINHEECFFDINHNDEYMGLDFSFNQSEEEIEITEKHKIKTKKDYFDIRLNYKVKRIIEKVIVVLRGENSINNIVKEGKDYFEKTKEKEVI
jgi:hypothetical protein